MLQCSVEVRRAEAELFWFTVYIKVSISARFALELCALYVCDSHLNSTCRPGLQCSVSLWQTSPRSGPYAPEGARPARTKPLWTHFTTTLSKTERGRRYSDSEGKKRRESAGRWRNRRGWLWWRWSKKGHCEQRLALGKEGQADTGWTRCTHHSPGLCFP